jgi:hypothetical protein
MDISGLAPRWDCSDSTVFAFSNTHSPPVHSLSTCSAGRDRSKQGVYRWHYVAADKKKVNTVQLSLALNIGFSTTPVNSPDAEERF